MGSSHQPNATLAIPGVLTTGALVEKMVNEPSGGKIWIPLFSSEIVCPGIHLMEDILAYPCGNPVTLDAEISFTFGLGSG